LYYAKSAMTQVAAAIEVVANFAGPHLYSAARFARLAHAVEAEGLAATEPPRFHDELQSHVVATVLLSACAAEAWAGEVTMRPAEHFAQPFAPGLEKELTALLRIPSMPDKYKALARLAVQPEPDFTTEPDKGLDDLRRLRNALVHFHPESLSQLKTHADITQRLSTRCMRSVLLDASAPHFPMAFASYDCARWAVETVREFIERFARRCGWKHPWVKPTHAEKLALPSLAPGRPLSTEQVVWTWLVHENTYKGALYTLSKSVPALPRLSHPMPEVVDRPMLETLARHAEPQLHGYGRAVEQTIAAFLSRTWTEVRRPMTVIGTAVRTSLDESPTEPISALRARRARMRTARDEEAHQHLLALLRDGTDLGPIPVFAEGMTVADAGHRLFALLDFAEERVGLEAVLHIGRIAH
jgi:hypothetical protein